MSDDEGKKNANENIENNIFANSKLSYKNQINLRYINIEQKIDEDGQEFSVEGKIPVNGLVIKPKISNREAKLGVGVGNETADAGLFVSYDFKKKEAGIGAEVSLCDTVNADASIKCNLEEDVIKINVGMDFMVNDPSLCYPNCPVKSGPSVRCDFINIEIKDVAHNTIGKALDNTFNVAADFIGHVSPNIRNVVEFTKELNEQANNVRNIENLNDIIRKVGDNELARNNIVANSQIHIAELNYLAGLDESIKNNTYNIAVNRYRLDVHEDIINDHSRVLNAHSQILANHENRLNLHDKILSEHSRILSNHEKRLNQHERILSVHTAMLMNHDRRLNQHERILNSHENRLNRHESILNMHSNILSKHEEALNFHEEQINNLSSIFNQQGQLINLQGKKLIELDGRMINVEKNINVLNKQVKMHSEILSQHGEILNNQGECIQELYNIANEKQIRLNKHSQIINEHQNAIVQLYSNFHGLKNRVENDEKAIKDLGNNISKVIKFSVDTDNIINGLIDQSQINQDLIVQNNNDIIEIKKELKNHANFILMHHQLLQDISKSLELQWKIINIQDKEINEIKQFSQNLSNEINNIHNQLDELKNKLSDIEKNFDTLQIAKRIKKMKRDKNYIKERVDELIENVDEFDEKQKSDFIKCMFMAINNGTYNLEHLEKVAENITNNI